MKVDYLLILTWWRWLSFSSCHQWSQMRLSAWGFQPARGSFPRIHSTEGSSTRLPLFCIPATDMCRTREHWQEDLKANLTWTPSICHLIQADLINSCNTVSENKPKMSRMPWTHHPYREGATGYLWRTRWRWNSPVCSFQASMAKKVANREKAGWLGFSGVKDHAYILRNNCRLGTLLHLQLVLW